MLEDFRLKVFEAVVETGSFTKAALLLNVSQPAVSQNVAELERITGYPLFERSYGKVSLTPEGLTFKSYADKILMWYRAAGETFHKGALLPRSVSVGVMDDVSTSIAARLLSGLSSFYRDLSFEVGPCSENDDLRFVTVSDTLSQANEPSVEIRPALICAAGEIGTLGLLSTSEEFLAADVRIALWSGYPFELPLELQPLVRLRTSSFSLLQAFLHSGSRAVVLLPMPAASDLLASRAAVLLPLSGIGNPELRLQVRVEASPVFLTTPLWPLVNDLMKF